MSSINLKDIYDQIVSFDHTYEYSDDHRVWSAGNREEKEIIAITSKLTQEEKMELHDLCKNWFNKYYSDHPKFLDWDASLKERNKLFIPVIYKIMTLCQIEVNV